jgi:hypothetical protein
MNVAEALEVDGKIESATSNRIAFLDEFGILRWDDDDSLVMLEDIVGAWLPYYEEKENRPEKAGELWKNSVGEVCHTIMDDGELWTIGNNGRYQQKNIRNWTRLYPPVEDDSVERIEIEGVKFSDHYRDAVDKDVYTIRLDTKYLSILQNRLPMKMTLEIPK